MPRVLESPTAHEPINGEATATARGLEPRAESEYEDLVWQVAVATGDDGNFLDALATQPSGYGCVLFAAQKSLHDFAVDVEAARRRVVLRPGVDEWLAADEERRELFDQRRALEAEREVVVKQYEVRLAALDEQRHANESRLAAVNHARNHYIRSAPAWLRRRFAELSRQQLPDSGRERASLSRTMLELRPRQEEENT